MKKVETLRQLQLVYIYIYRELRQYCNDHGLQVYLHGGSLIGAIRHKGFIPWDDDVDVAMSRPDYEKMINESGGRISDSCTVIDPGKDRKYKGYIPVAVYNNSSMTSGQYRDKEDLKIGVSIFVYDGITDNRILQKIYYQHMFILRAKHALCRADFDHVNTSVAKKVGPLLQRFYKIDSVSKYKERILKLQQKYDYNRSAYVSTNADYLASREVCSKVDFEKAYPVSFEGIKSWTYSHYDTHLRKYYGDYMQLPPEEERNAKHSFDAWIDEGFDYTEKTGE